MFDIGFSEIVVIGVVALIVFGPEDLPKVARIAGRMLGNFRRYVDQVKNELDQEIQASELKQLGQDIKESAQTLQASLNEQMHAVESEWQSAASEAGKVAHELAAPAEEMTAAVHVASISEPVVPVEPVMAEPAVEPSPELAEVAAPTPVAKRKRSPSAKQVKIEDESALTPLETIPVMQEEDALAAPSLKVETAPEAQVELLLADNAPTLSEAEPVSSSEKSDDQLDMFGMPEPSAVPHKA